MRIPEIDGDFPSPFQMYNEIDLEGIDVSESENEWAANIERFIYDEGPADLRAHLTFNIGHMYSAYLYAYDFEDEFESDAFIEKIENHIDWLHENMDEWVVYEEGYDDDSGDGF